MYSMRWWKLHFDCHGPKLCNFVLKVYPRGKFLALSVSPPFLPAKLCSTSLKYTGMVICGFPSHLVSCVLSVCSPVLFCSSCFLCVLSAPCLWFYHTDHLKAVCFIYSVNPIGKISNSYKLTVQVINCILCILNM